MTDIALDNVATNATYGDWYVVNGDLAGVDNVAGTPAAVLQDILQRLRTVYGECFMDNTIGLPYFTQILVKNPNLDQINVFIKNEILATPGVETLISYQVVSSNLAMRSLEISFKAMSINGIVDYTGVV